MLCAYRGVLVDMRGGGRVYLSFGLDGYVLYLPYIAVLVLFLVLFFLRM